MILSKLRRRIICVLTMVVVLLMAVVIACVYSITAQQLVERQKEVLRTVALLPMGPPEDSPDHQPVRKGHRTYSPFFAMRYDADGQLTASYMRLFEIDEETAVAAAEAAFNTRQMSGKLDEFSLRFLMRTDSSGSTRITFISTEDSESQLHSHLGMSLLIGTASALLLFFFVSLPLSKWLVKPVEEAWNTQKQFVADASHELKTPLTVILANLSIIRKRQHNTIADCTYWLESTEEEAQQMRHLIDEMLSLARTEDEQAAATYTEVNVADVLERTVMSMEPVAYENSAVIDCSIPEQATVVGSIEYLRRLFTILLDNAIKYAGEEKQISVQLIQQPDRLHIRIHNTGTPIPPEMLQHIFQRFYRGDANRTSNGFGLGLPIAKQIAEMHGGSIQVRSTAKEGTTFSVTLPTRQRGHKF